jgi:hypothetical protein
MDESRKRVLLIAASILAARKLANWDGRPSPALESSIADAIAWTIIGEHGFVWTKATPAQLSCECYRLLTSIMLIGWEYSG